MGVVDLSHVSGSESWHATVVGSVCAGLELECESGGKRNWCGADPVDGNGSVVETLSVTEHERSDSHQRTSALLGRTCDQN